MPKDGKEAGYAGEHERTCRMGVYSQRQFALYSMHMGPILRTQSQLHFGVLSAGQVILQVSLMPIPHDTISQELALSATRGGSVVATGVVLLAPMKSCGFWVSGSSAADVTGTLEIPEHQMVMHSIASANIRG